MDMNIPQLHTAEACERDLATLLLTSLSFVYETRTDHERRHADRRPGRSSDNGGTDVSVAILLRTTYLTHLSRILEDM